MFIFSHGLNMCGKPVLIFVTLLHFVNVLAEWNSNDYMKREHSLIKPYQGKTFRVLLVQGFRSSLR